MHYSIYSAGKLLAEFGREEVLMCIRGLQQYGISYDDALDQAAELQQMYASTRVEPEPVPQAWEGVSDAENHNNVCRFIHGLHKAAVDVKQTSRFLFPTVHHLTESLRIQYSAAEASSAPPSIPFVVHIFYHMSR